MKGLVTIYDSGTKGVLGEWGITIDDQSVHHVPKDLKVNPRLPPICQRESIMGEVESMARIYFEGYNRKREVLKWIEPTEDEEKCRYCGNSFCSPQHLHTTCGMD
jgi:hypothetical protein